jgi:hypothetical protein
MTQYDSDYLRNKKTETNFTSVKSIKQIGTDADVPATAMLTQEKKIAWNCSASPPFEKKERRTKELVSTTMSHSFDFALFYSRHNLPRQEKRQFLSKYMLSRNFHQHFFETGQIFSLFPYFYGNIRSRFRQK